MSSLSLSQEDRRSMLPSAVVAVLWTAVVVIPLLFMFKERFHFSQNATILAGVLALNGAVGVLWTLSAFKSMLGVVATTTAATGMAWASDSNEGDSDDGRRSSGLFGESDLSSSSPGLMSPSSGFLGDGMYDSASSRPFNDD